MSKPNTNITAATHGEAFKWVNPLLLKFMQLRLWFSHLNQCHPIVKDRNKTSIWLKIDEKFNVMVQ